MNPSEKPKQTEHNYAGVFLVNEDNKIIGQLRDNKPNIDHPNQISAFGGTIERGEKPIDAAWRELVNEETNLKIDINEIQPLTSYVAWRELTSEWETLNFYYVHITNEMLADLEVYEGQGWAYINEPSQVNIVDPIRPAVTKLFEIVSGRQNEKN